MVNMWINMKDYFFLLISLNYIYLYNKINSSVLSAYMICKQNIYKSYNIKGEVVNKTLCETFSTFDAK